MAVAALLLAAACGRESPGLTADDSCITPLSLSTSKPRIVIRDSALVRATVLECDRMRRVVVAWSVTPDSVASVYARGSLSAMVVGRHPGTAAVGARMLEGATMLVGIPVQAP